MKILFASGKGGAGKTTVTASMAQVWPRSFVLCDADAEAPDLALFVPHTFESQDSVGLEVPSAFNERCDLCGDCVEMCQFNAVKKLGTRMVAFADLCHGCGGCEAVCPHLAIVMGRRELGTVSAGRAFDRADFLEARSRIGEAMTPPLIRELLHRGAKLAGTGCDLLVDAPPGVSCPAMTALRGADAVVLVADPTPFGFYDFRLALQAFGQTGKPVFVIINRSGCPESKKSEKELVDLCNSKALPIIARLPFAAEAAALAAGGQTLASLSTDWEARFRTAADSLITALSAGDCHE